MGLVVPLFVFNEKSILRPIAQRVEPAPVSERLHGVIALGLQHSRIESRAMWIAHELGDRTGTIPLGFTAYDAAQQALSYDVVIDRMIPYIRVVSRR